MRLCFALPEIDTTLVYDVGMALARYNERTYTCAPHEKCTRSPWHLRYEPAAGDSEDGGLGDHLNLVGPMVTVRDAVTLMSVGSGACLELSAAYVGWLLAHGWPADLRVWVTAPNTWHVNAVVGNSGIIDPAQPETLHRWRLAYGMR